MSRKETDPIKIPDPEVVPIAERGDRIRIISARELTRAERRAYEEEICD